MVLGCHGLDTSYPFSLGEVVSQMNKIDVSKIPADVMAEAERIYWLTAHPSFTDDPWVHIAIGLLTERAACAQHAFAMRWAPSPDLAGTKNAALISQITTDWSQKIGMGILNR